MNTEQERMQDILIETINYYGESPTARRAVNDVGTCMYHDYQGRHCALGRCMEDPIGVQRQTYGTYPAMDLDQELNNGLDELLEEQYRGLPIDFWDCLQQLHDSSMNWGRTGLSELGRCTVAKACDVFKLDLDEIRRSCSYCWNE